MTNVDLMINPLVSVLATECGFNEQSLSEHASNLVWVVKQKFIHMLAVFDLGKERA